MGLSPLSEALQSALSVVRPGPVERVPVAEARGCLAERIVATRDVPGCDNSAMDGYALRAEETRGANRDQPARFRVVETIYAGHRPEREIGPGEAARLFTGAPTNRTILLIVGGVAATIAGLTGLATGGRRR